MIVNTFYIKQSVIKCANPLSDIILIVLLFVHNLRKSSVTYNLRDIIKVTETVVNSI